MVEFIFFVASRAVGLGLLEIVIIAVAALVLLGPERLPDVLRQLGKVYVQFRRSSNEFRGVFDHMVRQAEEELRITEIKRLTDLAGQGSKIAQNAAAELQQINDDYHHAPVNHDIGSPYDHKPPQIEDTPLPEASPAPLQTPPGREARAADAWDPPTSPLIAPTAPTSPEPKP